MDAVNTTSMPEGTKARRVFLSLKDEISGGRLNDGDSLPGEQKLAEAFGVSRVTVRRALEKLAANGFIERRAGSGTVVRATSGGEKPVEMDFTTLMPQLVEMGQKTTVRLLSFNYGKAPGYVAKAMKVQGDTQVQTATRLRLASGIPFSHLTTYVPQEIARNYSENDLATTPLFKLLERSGVQIEEANQSVSAALAGPQVAEVLEVETGAALLSLERVVRDIDGNCVEFLSALYRPDMFQLEMSLARVGEGSGRHWEPVIGKGHEE